MIKSIPHFFIWPILSGLLAGTSYIPFKGLALLFCYIPLWVFTLKTLEKNSYFRIFLAGWITQFVLTLIGFNWIYYVAREFGHLHWTLSSLALLSFAALMHLYIPVALTLGAYLIRKLRIRRSLPRLLTLALMLALLERIWPSIFEWNLAYTLLWMGWSLFQWADLIGFWGLSALLYLAQALLAYVILSFRPHPLRAGVVLAMTTLSLALLTWSGEQRAIPWRQTDASLKVLLAQGNVGNAEKLQSETGAQYHTHIRQIYSALTEEALVRRPADIIIWPETALPFPLDSHYMNRPEQSQLLQKISQWKVPVITGGYSVSLTEKDHLQNSLYRNAVFYLSPQFDYAEKPYYKTNLLVFGEYMPLGKVFPFLYQLLPFVGTYGEGSGAQIATLNIDSRPVRLGPQICYDSLDTNFSRQLALNGAQIIFNVTNDAWFGWWAEPFQHGWMTLARAVEVRRPLARATNTGISTVILADGRWLETSPMNKAWSQVFDIPYISEPAQTFYTRYGYLDWIFWSLLLFLNLLIFRGKGKNV